VVVGVRGVMEGEMEEGMREVEGMEGAMME